MSVLYGDSKGGFVTTYPFVTGGEQAQTVSLADMNGDGKPDVVVADYCANRECERGEVGVLLNTFLARLYARQEFAEPVSCQPAGDLHGGANVALIGSER